MPIDAYPVGLPGFLLDGHGREAMPLVDRVEMEVGPARQYRDFTTAPQIVSCSTLLWQSQFDAFFDFYEQTLRAAELTFYAQIAGSAYSSGLEWWESRFVGPHSEPVKNGYRYLVSFKLRLLAGPFFSKPS